MEKHYVNINKQSRSNGTQCRKKLMPFGHPYWYSALAALRAPFGIHRAIPAFGRRCPWGTLWSALPFGHPLVGVALRAPSGLLGYASIPMFQAKSRLRVEFQQTIARENYIWHLYDIFKNPVGRLCWHASTSTGYSWGWCPGSTICVVLHLRPP